MRYWLSALLLVLPLAASAQVYRWVDDDGVVHYGDQPGPGAQRADLPELQSAEPPDHDIGGQESGPPATDAVEAGLKIASPVPDATFRDARGLVPVTLAPASPLGPKERVMYYLDGEPVLDAPTSRTSVQFEGVARGKHTVSAALLRGDREIARTEPVTIHLKPPTALTPLTQSAPDGDQPPGAGSAPAGTRSGGAPGAPRFNTGP